MPNLDIEQFLTLAGFCPTPVLAQLVRSYVESVPDHLCALQRALEAKDGVLLAYEAHGLRGMSLNLGARAAADRARALAEAANLGRFEDAGRELDELRRTQRATWRELEDAMQRIGSPMRAAA